MGRVGRYKKIKAFDPFSRSGGVVDHDAGKSYEHAPRARDFDSAPKKARALFKFKEKVLSRMQTGKTASTAVQSGGGIGSSADASNSGHAALSSLTAMPGESQKAFNRRVNRENTKQREALRNQAGSGKSISEKRKRYLNDKKAMKRARKLGLSAEGATEEEHEGSSESHNERKKRMKLWLASESHSEEQRQQCRSRSSDRPPRDEFQAVDHVKFGERVMEPPRALPEPRKSQKMKQREAAAQSAGPAEVAAIAAAARESELRTARLQRDRAEAIAAYAQLRKRKTGRE